MSNLELRIDWSGGSQSFSLASGRSYSFGRAADRDLRLDAPFVSRHHGTFVESSGEWLYRQAGATTPMLVDGASVTEVVVRSGMVLTVPGPDGSQATISVLGTGGGVHARDSGALRATVTAGVNVGRSISGAQITVGREGGGAEHLQLEDPRVSREHVTLRLNEAGGVVVRDMGSQNGTTVSRGGEQQVLRDGEAIFGSASGELVLLLGDSAVRVDVVPGAVATAAGGGGRRNDAPARAAGGSRALGPVLLAGAGIVASVAVLFLVIVGVGGASDDVVPTATATAVPTATTTTTPEPTEVAVSCDLEETAETAIGATALVVAGDGIGTAFHIGDGLFVTAEHVVSGLSTVYLDNERISGEAEVLATDEQADVAMLRMSVPRSLPVLEWSDEELRVGRTVATVGYPGAQAEIVGSGSLSRGTVSKLFSLGAIQVIQTDVPVNPGNSGGALIDECGAVVGVVVRKAVDVQVEGIAYATTAESAQRALRGASSR